MTESMSESMNFCDIDTISEKQLIEEPTTPQVDSPKFNSLLSRIIAKRKALVLGNDKTVKVCPLHNTNAFLLEIILLNNELNFGESTWGVVVSLTNNLEVMKSQYEESMSAACVEKQDLEMNLNSRNQDLQNEIVSLTKI